MSPSSERPPLTTKLKRPPSGISYKMFYQVLFSTCSFGEHFISQKTTPGMFLSHTIWPFFTQSSWTANKEEAKSESGLLWILPKVLAGFFVQGPGPHLEGRGVTILGMWSGPRTEKTRRGSTRTQDIYISGSQGKSETARQEKQIASENIHGI